MKPTRGNPKGVAPQRQEAAERLAIAALGFLAGERERLERFLALTGLGPESLRAAARDPKFLSGVLDHVASDEGLLVAFAEDQGIGPQEIERARAVLAGRSGQTGAA